MLWNIAVNDAGASYDPLTLLRSRTMFGRPDWNSVYTRMKQAIESGQYIPGSNSQLKTKVGVRRFSHPPESSRLISSSDILLWSQCPCQGYQGGYGGTLGRQRRVLICKGAFLND